MNDKSCQPDDTKKWSLDNLKQANFLRVISKIQLLWNDKMIKAQHDNIQMNL